MALLRHSVASRERCARLAFPRGGGTSHSELFQSIGTGIGRSCSMCYPPIYKPLHAARRTMSAASHCPEATAAFQNNHILSQIKMMDPSRASQPPAPYGRQIKERGKRTKLTKEITLPVGLVHFPLLHRQSLPPPPPHGVSFSH